MGSLTGMKGFGWLDPGSDGLGSDCMQNREPKGGRWIQCPEMLCSGQDRALHPEVPGVNTSCYRM